MLGPIANTTGYLYEEKKQQINELNLFNKNYDQHLYTN